MLIFRLLPLICLGGSLAFASGTNDGKVREGLSLTQKGKLQKWKKLPISFCLHDSIPQNKLAPIKEAFRIWNSSFKKPLFDFSCASKGKKQIGELGQNNVYWLTTDFEKYSNKTSVARTIRSFDEDSGEIVDADIIINAEFFDWNTTKADLISIMVHELGHVLSLQHNFISRKSPMNYFPYQAGLKVRQLSEHELSTVKGAYLGGKDKIAEYIEQYLQNNFVAAISFLESKEKKSADELYSLARLYSFRKNNQKAQLYWSLFLKDVPKSSAGWNYLGEIAWDQNKIKDAKRFFEKALAFNPQYYESMANLGSILFSENKKEEAQKYFEEVLKIVPVHYISCFYLLQITKDAKYQACIDRFAPKGF